LITAHAKLEPLEIRLTPLSAADAVAITDTGLGDLVRVPLPSWPFAFSPQHFALPFEPDATTTHVNAPPALTDETDVRLGTTAGEVRVVYVPSPTCPLLLSPQQRTVESTVRAQLWFPPAETWLGALRLNVLNEDVAVDVRPEESVTATTTAWVPFDHEVVSNWNAPVFMSL
jgi:hypothetical protein